MLVENYDLVVIGGGATGLVASAFGGKFKLKVALIEREALGGDCTWTGCMPSKALLKVAKMAQSARQASEYGIKTGDISVDMTKIRDYIKTVVAEIYAAETPIEFSKRGVEVILGEASFINAHTLQVDQRQISAKRIIIATGGRPHIPNIPGLGNIPFKTSRTIFDNDILPSRLLVMGAGPMGVELSQAYARLGAQVSLIDKHFLPHDEPEVAEVMRPILESEGVCFIKALVKSAQMIGHEISLRLDNGDEVPGDMLLVAVGRRPNIESLNLSQAGIDYTEEGITVNSYLQTTVKHIYAIGDCVGSPYFTHRAGFQAMQAGRNALFPGGSKADQVLLPWVTFTEPEVAHVGMTQAQAEEKYGSNAKTYLFSLKHGDRAVCEDDTEGFVKLVYRGSGDLLGATIIAARAGEMVTEFALAIKNGLNLSTISSTIHAYPTYSDIVHKAVSEVYVEELFQSLNGKMLQRVAKFVSSRFK